MKPAASLVPGQCIPLVSRVRFADRELGAGSIATTMPCHRLERGRPSASEQQVDFSHSCPPRAMCTPFRHLAFWLSGRHLGGRCGWHLHLIRLGRDFGRGFGGDRTCNGGRIRWHWLIRRRRVQQDRCRTGGMRRERVGRAAIGGQGDEPDVAETVGHEEDRRRLAGEEPPEAYRDITSVLSQKFV